ncbi:hypothetical protein K2X83_00975 [Patescibacteria group bacterium]|nr:hypothetical protein [Patescibacteria group bacterium]
MNTKKVAFIGSAFLIFISLAGGLLYYATTIGCSDMPQSVTPVMGSQGFRLWSGPTLISFEHGDKKICIPSGWEALGEETSGNGWARYEKGVSGLTIKKDAFAEAKLTFISSGYEVHFVYPKNTPAGELELYEATIRSAFENVGALFNDSHKNEKRRHTILVTPGVERADELRTPIYPDPRKNLSPYMQPPTSARGEELLIHAIAHLYNRQRADLRAYQKNQLPIPAEDFQELEASWSEIAYRTSDSGRRARINYLYNVHTAVQTKNFSLIHTAPFNGDRAGFENIAPNIVVPPDASFLNAQYGHYILGPLTMVAIEGMLAAKNADTVEKILSRVHAENMPFINELSKYLSPEEIAAAKSWMFDGGTIPRALVDAGLTRYEIQ